jgi:hypothetical protein
MIILLPSQNRFTIDDPEFRLPSLPPKRPQTERIDADLFTKVKVGILRDTTEAKRMKDGRRIVRAGNYAFLRLCPTSVKKAYNLTDSLGSVVAVRDVLFLDGFATHQQRQIRAVQAIRTLRAETESIMDSNRRRMETWTLQRKVWELRLVYHVWDHNVGVFPPYVTAREQLGETEMDIPHEWVQKPYYQSNHYCGCCLEPMPLICNVCRADIDKQQEEAQQRIAQEETRTTAVAHTRAQAIDETTNKAFNDNETVECGNSTDEDDSDNDKGCETTTDEHTDNAREGSPDLGEVEDQNIETPSAGNDPETGTPTPRPARKGLEEVQALIDLMD